DYKFEYNSNGNPVKNYVEDELKTANDYNYLTKIKETESGEGIVTKYSYNFISEIIKSKISNLPFSERKNIWKSGSINSQNYFEEIQNIDEELRTNIVYLNNAGLKVAQKVGSSAVTKFNYNSIYQLSSVISPKGLTTNYLYNNNGNISQRTTPDDGVYQYKYDKFGNLRFTYHTTYTPSKTLFNTYDNLFRLIRTGETTTAFSSLNADNSYTQFETDANSLIINMYDDYISNTVFPTLIPHVQVLENTKGRLVATAFRDATAPADQNWSYKLYSYDPLGNIKTIHIKLNGKDWKFISNDYDHAGKLVFQNISNDHFTWNEYDEQGRLKIVKSNKTNDYANAILEVEYAYNNDDQIIRIGSEGYEKVLENLTVTNTQTQQAPLVVANTVTVNSGGNLT
ncbi:MAG: hypothetical protein KC414_10205, partial [Romboutsia sp.]|nr:hypothetical protein [Romboutsia sp.]